MDWLDEFTMSILLEQGKDTLNGLVNLPGFPQDRQGGYLNIRSASDGRTLILVPLGKIPPEKITRYCEFSKEKTWRLFQHPDHISSWQSRNENQEEYGGAIRIPRRNLLMSFLGLTPDTADEVLCLDLADSLGWITEGEAQGIAYISNNKWYFDYVKAYYS